ncbi:MAG: cytochrome ubiquinol oxidase subunit I [Nitrospirota bacterium]
MGSFFKRRFIKRQAVVTALTFTLLLFVPILSHLIASAPDIINASAAFAAEKKEAVESPAAKKEEKSKVEYPPAPKLKEKDYPRIKSVNSRIAVWILAQIHLFFAAFVLAVPIFVLVIEGVGKATGDERYDHMAHEFIKVSMTAFSLTATSGGILVFMLIAFYPDFMKYLASVFGSVMIIYAMLFLAESIFLYIYYYGWDNMRYGFRKWVHLTLGLMLNVVGMTIMVLGNSWATFMMAPSGVDASGVFTGNVWEAIRGPLWNALNLHRFIANIAYGGSVVGAYAAYKFLSAKSKEERAHYDWMGYTANIIAISALLPLPFAGYWLTAEIYAYSQTMGITLMGGAFAWLFITQAVLIGALFLSANYYLWCGMERIKGSERYTKYVKYIAAVIVICFLVWFTPHSLIMNEIEKKAVGGTHHPLLGPLGLMPAKNSAVNIMILFTFLSFTLYKRSSKITTAAWAKSGVAAEIAIFAVGIVNIIALGIYSYMVPSNIKVGMSVPQVFNTLSIIIAISIIESRMFKNAKSTGDIEWGKMPARSQYALLLLAVSFTWLMGLMGYVRSAIRQHWHVNSIMRDSSPDAFTPTIGYAANVVSVTTILFMLLVIFVFWLAQFAAKKQAEH